MSLSNIYSSFATPFSSSAHLLAAVTDASSSQYNCTEQRVFTVVPKSAGYVLGEKLSSLFSFVYSRLPTLSLPVAQASSTESCRESSCAADHCKPPIGSYLDSCHRPTVTYLPNEAKCLLQTRCATIYDAIPHTFNQLEFHPKDSLMLENQNGTLAILNEQKNDHISPEKANAKLADYSKTIKKINQDLDDRAIKDTKREKLERSKELFLKKQNEVIRRLNPGDIITVDDAEQPLIITPENRRSHDHFYNTETIDSFQTLASSTGGIMGLSRSPKFLPLVMEKLFAHILHSVLPDESLDIALVLDTTDSMSNDIKQIKQNLVNFLDQLKSKNPHTTRVAVMEYRDKNDYFLNRVNTDFSSDLDTIRIALKNIKVSGGGDTPEAVLDALLATKENLSWDQHARRIAILIGDAPPHPKTVDNLYDQTEVINHYQMSGINIAIYPIVTDSRR